MVCISTENILHFIKKIVTEEKEVNTSPREKQAKTNRSKNVLGQVKKIFLGTLYLHPPTFLQPSLPPPLSLPPLHYHHHSVLIYSNSYYFLCFLLFLFSMFPSFLFLFVPFLDQKVLFWGYWLGSKKFLESTHIC